MEPKSKSCPMCGEEILEVAIKCKHCKSDLPAEQPLPSDHAGSPEVRPDQPFRSTKWRATTIAGGLLAALMLVGIAAYAYPPWWTDRIRAHVRSECLGLPIDGLSSQACECVAAGLERKIPGWRALRLMETTENPDELIYQDLIVACMKAYPGTSDRNSK